jgi:hypothetical protein
MENDIDSEKLKLWKSVICYNFEDLVTPDIWDQIFATFSGQNTSLRVFANKLKKKLGWERDFAFQAIIEYKKFVYLGVISKNPVTPSKIIDQLWHEHLLFSAGYRNFCDNVLQYNFDHHPELVPSTESTQVFRDQYQYTLDLYKSEFGIATPPEIWNQTKFEEIDSVIESKRKYEFRGTYEMIPLIEFVKIHYQKNYEKENIDTWDTAVLGHYLVDMYNDNEVNNYSDGGSDSSDSSSGDSSSCSSSCGSSCGGGD